MFVYVSDSADRATSRKTEEKSSGGVPEPVSGGWVGIDV